jgi:Tfp pilus assembly protein PilF
MRSGAFDKPVLHLAVITLLGLIVYSNTFNVPFQFDDVSNITKNTMIRDVSNVPSFFRGGSGPFASRPLLHATVAINYYLGGTDTRGYHALNLALHLINAVLLYFLVVITGRHIGFKEGAGRLAGFLASLLFTVHPLQTEAVTYIVSRSVLFSTTFYLSGIILFFRAVTSEKRRSVYIAGLFAVSLLGMASRENFAMFPLMLVLYDLLFISRFSAREAAGHYRAYIPVLVTLGYFVFLAANNTYVRSPGLPGWGIEPLEYIYTQFNVHATYLRLLVLPINQNLDYDYPIARALFELPTLLSFMGYLGLWAAGILLVKKRPMVSFGVLWFVVTLVPISFAVAFMGLRLGNPIFEHRAYLPSAGAIVAAVWGLVVLTEKSEALRKGAVSLLVALAVVFSIAAYVRNGVWRSEVSLWSDVVEKAPNNAMAYGNLGAAYSTEGRYDLAVKYFRLQMRLHKERGHYKRGPISGRERPEAGADPKSLHGRDVKTAIEYFETAIDMDPGNAAAHNNLGMLYRKEGRTDKAIEHYEAALGLEPDNAEFHTNLANAYDIEGRTDKAIEHYKEAIRLMPEYALAHYNLGIAYINKGQPDKAREELRRALEIEPGFDQARRVLEQMN